MHKFFKWIKQHLKIKKFWGTSENAVRIQIYSAIIAYCMMAIVQKKMNIERSIYESVRPDTYRFLQDSSVTLRSLEESAKFCEVQRSLMKFDKVGEVRRLL